LLSSVLKVIWNIGGAGGGGVVTDGAVVVGLGTACGVWLTREGELVGEQPARTQNTPTTSATQASANRT
jgi:hypothetical protein